VIARLLGLALLASTGPVPLEPAPLTLTLRPTQARLGEWIEADVSGPLPGSSIDVGPRFGDEVGGLEVLESSPRPAPAGVLRWHLRLVAFEPGRHVVPPLAFWCRRAAAGEEEVSTAPVEVEILPPGLPPGAELRPSKRPLALPLTSLERWAMLLVAGGAIVPAGLALRRRRRSPAKAAPAGPPPRERALRELRNLEREIPVPPARVAALYARVLEILRGFLVDADGLPAFHMTSGQIQDAAGARVVPAVRDALAEALVAADAARFGGRLPDGATQARDLEAARRAVGSWRAPGAVD